MQNPRLAGRYAKSLLDIAVEKNELEKVYTDVKYIQAVIAASSEFVNVLRSPIIKADKKLAIVSSVTQNKVGAILEGFNKLLIAKNREANLPEILNAFEEQYNTLKNISKVKLTSATELSDTTKQAIISRLEKDAGLANIQLQTKIDERLIGGFVLEYNNNIVDASIIRDLKDIKKQFSQNVYVHAIR